MKVFYTASYYGKDEYQEYYDLVREVLKQVPSIKLYGTEVGNYTDFLNPRLRKRLSEDPELLHYEAVRLGIKSADAVVMEVSHEDIQLGHEATLAVHEKKPVLCLSLQRDLSEKIRNPYFFGAKYTRKSVKSEIEEFLQEVRAMSKTERFNMFLYEHQREYLQEASEREGMNMSEYMRHLITLDRQLKEG